MDSLVPAYRQMAKEGSSNFNGMTVLNYVKSIKALAHSVGARTMLDFGCGRGDAYRSPTKLHHQLGMRRPEVTLYDPAFNVNSSLPKGTYDLVVCSDVLEHIPEAEVDEFVIRLFAYARRAVWASVCCRPAKKFFPDGVTNLHVTVKPHQWWHDTFSQHARQGVVWELVETP